MKRIIIIYGDIGTLAVRVLTLALLALTLVARPARADGTCADTIGLPLSAANRKEVVFFGRAWGQVFEAPETLLASVR